MSETKSYEQKEVEKHNKEEDCWVVVKGKVYDVSKFDDHPGSKDILVEFSGGDATEEFEDIGHSQTALDMMKSYYIGDYVAPEKEELPATAKGRNPFLLLAPILIMLLALFVAKVL